MQEAVSRKNNAHNAMCRNHSEENKRRHGSIKNIAKKVVSKAMK